MKTSLDCIPCLVQQCLKVARMATADEKVHEAIFYEACLDLWGRHSCLPVRGTFESLETPDWKVRAIGRLQACPMGRLTAMPV